MKVIMVMVSSVDGRTTQGNNKNIYTWSSAEDQQYFFSLIKKNNLIVMGRETYETISPRIKLQENKLRIVLTRYPEKYLSKAVKGQLEFSHETPKQLVKRLSLLGYKAILVVGGSLINGLFLKEKLVDELFLTIEPRIFGNGKNIVEGQLLNKSLQLISVKKLNKAGTLLLKYRVIPSL